MNQPDLIKRQQLEDAVRDKKLELYKLRETRYDNLRVSSEVSNEETVLICEEYKFAFGEGYKYCKEHGHADCDCVGSKAAFIAYKWQEGYGAYPFYVNTEIDAKYGNHYKWFLYIAS